jgi:two-component system chemotaxis response regulator CheY
MLVVKDQSDLRRTFVGMLKRMGASAVHGASNDQEAMDLVNHHPVDFIVCEWDAPELNGIALLREVRKNSTTGQIPFILISGQDQMGEEDFAEATDYEVDGHLIKPLKHKDLEGKVQKILKERAESMESSVRLARAAAFVDIGEADEAEEEIASAQEAQLKSTRVLVESGQLFEAMGKDDKAKKSYLHATKVDEAYAKAYEGMSSVLEKEGKSAEALELLEKAVKISPRNTDRQFKIAKVIMGNGNEDRARIALHKALESETDEAARSAAAAEFFMASGRADLAEAEYAFALEADPDNVNYFNRLGLAFRR